MTHERIKTSTLLYLLSGVMLTIVVGFAIFWEVRGQSAWNDAVDRTWKWEARSKRQRTRPVLYGLASPGHAWDDYELALLSYSRVDPRGERVTTALLANDLSQPHVMDLLAEATPALERVGEGARREFGPRGIEVARDSGEPLGAHDLIKVWRLKTRESWRSDAPDVHSILDGIQFARDLACGPTQLEEWIGASGLEALLKETISLQSEVSLPPASMSRLLQGLGRLEDGLSDHELSFPIEILDHVHNLDNGPPRIRKSGYFWADPRVELDTSLAYVERLLEHSIPSVEDSRGFSTIRPLIELREGVEAEPNWHHQRLRTQVISKQIGLLNRVSLIRAARFWLAHHAGLDPAYDDPLRSGFAVIERDRQLQLVVLETDVSIPWPFAERPRVRRRSK